MKTTVKLLMAATLILLPIFTNAQTEDPRGIYKMMTLTGKLGEVKAPFDQYKICTDSVTLMLNMQNSAFVIQNTDNKVFHHTGDQPEHENDKSSLIYDSNADHFTLKWWSTNRNHLYFPDNGWCIEKYEANQYSETARRAFDVLTATPAINPANPLLGTWRVIGYMDELRNVKRELAKLHEQYSTSKYTSFYVVFTPENYAAIIRNASSGIANPVEYDSKNTYRMGNKTIHVKWLSKNCIAVEEAIDYRIDWQILERVTDGQTMLSRIASNFVSGRRR